MDYHLQVETYKCAVDVPQRHTKLYASLFGAVWTSVTNTQNNF